MVFNLIKVLSLILFTFSGVIKGSVIFKPITSIFDLTAASFSLCVLFFLYEIIFKNKYIKLSTRIITFLLLYFSLVILACISFLFLSEGAYSQLKLIQFAVLTSSNIIFAITFIRTKKDLFIFLKLTVLLGLTLAFHSLIIVGWVPVQELDEDQRNGYQWLSRLAMISFLICYLVFKPRVKIHVIIKYIFLLFLFLLMIKSGGRQVIFSLLLCYVFNVFIFDKMFTRKQLVKYLFLFLMSSFLISLLINNYTSLENFRGIRRIFEFIELVIYLEFHSVIEDSGRLEPYIDGVKIIMNNPIIGVGFGNYQNVAASIYDHPHNSFLEIYSELGILGFIIFTLLVSLLFFNINHTKKNQITQGLFFVTLSSLATSLVSGDLGSNRVFYLFFILYLISLKYVNQRNI